MAPKTFQKLKLHLYIYIRVQPTCTPTGNEEELIKTFWFLDYLLFILLKTTLYKCILLSGFPKSYSIIP